MSAAPIKILLGPSSFGSADPAPLERLKAAGLEVVDNPFKRKLTQQELLDLLPGITGIIAGLEPLNRAVMAASQLKVISRVGVGLNNVDLEAAAELGIAVRYTPDAPTIAVAELTLGCLLNLLRRVGEMDRSLHACRWNKCVGYQLTGRTVLLVGLGRIGLAVARLLEPFRVRLLGCDPAVDQAPAGIELVSLQEGLAQADVISLHASGTEPILGPGELADIKPGAFLLNPSRGELVDEQGLVAALDQGRLAGAWLDAFWREPYDGPLTGYENVLLTPHVGSYSAECRLDMEMQAVDNLLEALGLAKDSEA
ncbi:MAG: phosphoglycerate dehydrogenase [Desulfarculaceae bacterium]|nr:phosphoglycerate dehydrogenase [Desulfarculaceae bacterium]MCF8072101.1 phosphoglycerate dehydrogenase [Desulfarculaceae bacterium]MCF8100022.1 phosphoglycerate dehydrogenase [Desulfarculaceae bacterium]